MRTPLHKAGWMGHQRVFDLLLTLGADPSILDRDGQPPRVMDQPEFDRGISEAVVRSGDGGGGSEFILSAPLPVVTDEDGGINSSPVSPPVSPPVRPAGVMCRNCQQRTLTVTKVMTSQRTIAYLCLSCYHKFLNRSE